MISILYVSTSTDTPDDADLSAILVAARTRNTDAGISGLLAYRAGRYIQLLEGPDDVTDDTFARIRRDPRHHDVQLVDRNLTHTRWFPDWAMAFEPLGDAQSTRSMPGFHSSSGAAGSRGRSDESAHAQALLHWFKQHVLSVAATR